MALIDSEFIVWQDGEALTFDDLNALGKGTTQRAWDIPGYADLLSHGIASPLYLAMFEGGADLEKLVFCKGTGGWVRKDGLSVFVNDGMLGVYAQAGSNVYPEALLPKMRWVFLGAPSEIVLDPSPAGQKRWVVLTLTCDEVDGGAEARDFEDAVTGAKTTVVLAKRRKLHAAFDLVQGVPSAGTPDPPAVSGHVVAMALVTDAFIDDLRDCTMPAGPVHTHTSFPGVDAIFGESTFGGDGWVRAGSPTTGLGARCVLDAVITLFPRMYGGDNGARLVAVQIDGAFDVTSGISLCALTLDAGADTFHSYSGSAVEDLTAAYAASPDGTIDLRGYPVSATAELGPYWGNCGRLKQGAGGGPMPAIRINGHGLDRINWVKWHFVKG